MSEKKSKIEVCGEHLMDSGATLNLIRKVDEYKKKGIDISRNRDGSLIKVCIKSEDRKNVKKIVHDLSQYQVYWNSLHTL